MKSVLLSLLAGSSLVNAYSDIANWFGLRGTIIGDVVVLEGGSMAKGTFNGKTFVVPGSATVSNGLYKNISLCNAINVDTDNTDDLMKDPLGQNIYTDNNYPVYIGGALFANDHQFATYGGLPDRPRVSGVTSVMLIDVYPYSVSATLSGPSAHLNQPLPDNLTDYITSGAYVSSPDKDRPRGWLFSGMQSYTGGELDQSVTGDDDPKHVNYSSPQFLEVDLSYPKEAKFTKMELPSWLTPRVEGGLVWLPYGDEGVLIAIGGVEIPGDLFLTLRGNATESGNTRNTFMTELAVYDIASQTWYTQETLEETPRPTQLAGFCNVVTQTQDASSYSIYVYGGYDGTLITDQQASDKVWVLSVPSFRWTLANEGTETHRRKSHICVAPNPTTMMSIGGAPEMEAYLYNNKSIDFFDLNTHQWTGKFDPRSEVGYTLHSDITNNIGGDPSSLPSGLNSSLASIFGKKYPGTVKAYKPYTCGSNPTNPAITAPTSNGTSKTTIIGAVVGVIGAVLIGVLIWWFVKKQKAKKAGIEKTVMRQNKVTSWFKRNSTTIDPESDPSNTGTDSTRVVRESDYFAYHNAKNVDGRVSELDSNMASPYDPSGHGTPYVTSPHLSGTHEVDAESRHEIMDRPANRESYSFRNHPMYPPSVGGSHIMSVKSESISHPSERLYVTHPYGHVSPCELAQDKSNENLSQPADLSLDNDAAENDRQAATGLLGAYSNQVQSPTAMTPTSPISRKPVNTDRRISTPDQSPDLNRQSHHRQNSSMSSNFPTGNFPSPGPEEAQRMSRAIDLLPEHQHLNSNAHAQRRSTGPIHSIYHEEFGDEAGARTWASR